MTTPIESLFELLSGSGWSGGAAGEDMRVGTAVHGTIDPSG